MASLLQGFKNLFWGSKDDGSEQQRNSSDSGGDGGGAGGRPMKGFQAKRQRCSAPPRSPPPEPVLDDAPEGLEGGVQGLDWYARTLRLDPDGELAHEALSSGDKEDGRGGPGGQGGGKGGSRAAAAAAARQAAGALAGAAAAACQVVGVRDGLVHVAAAQQPSGGAARQQGQAPQQRRQGPRGPAPR